MNVFYGQFLHGLSKFFPGVPMRAVIRTLAAVAALVEPQQAVPVEQSRHESPRRVTRVISAIARGQSATKHNAVTEMT